jgi:sulfur carrier protein
MDILVNGEKTSVETSLNVKRLLEIRGLSSSPCAVEVNRKLVPKRRHDEQLLAEGDQVEIVTLVGGG